MAWLDPRPIDADIGLAYASYYTHGGASNKQPNILRQMVQLIQTKALWLSRSRKTRQRMYLDSLPPGRVLDIGCGGGITLRLLAKAGWTAVGQEVDPVAAENARHFSGCDIHLGAIETLGLAAESFDAITMLHVIEHASSPVELLSICKGLLKPGGQLVLVTPNINSLGRHLYGIDWRGLEPPRHLQLFSQAALKTCAEQSGLQVAHVFTTSAFAAYFSLASQQIRASRLPGETHNYQWIKSMSFKIASTMLRTSAEGLGEELVLIAIKMADELPS
ncbi:MAG: class I SAM-dependent methyltransferase [Methylovulum sp.]|nr:class I SAM-dependent methyltransferase [Methylovulum sp.]